MIDFKNCGVAKEVGAVIKYCAEKHAVPVNVLPNLRTYSFLSVLDATEY